MRISKIVVITITFLIIWYSVLIIICQLQPAPTQPNMTLINVNKFNNLLISSNYIKISPGRYVTDAVYRKTHNLSGDESYGSSDYDDDGGFHDYAHGGDGR